jgi:hypothetical protein
MKKSVITFIMVLSFVSLVSAQDYKTGIGLRAGNSLGLTIKHYLNQKAAFEGLLKTRWQGFEITGLYEINNQAFDVSGLKWFYGVGGHIGFYNGDYVYWGRSGTTYTVVGIDGILGLEYTFTEIPINIGLDWKPALNLVGYEGLWSEGALSVRYVF